MRPILSLLATLKTTTAIPNVTVTPPSQNTSGASSSKTFAAETATVANGSASAYNWTVQSSSGGTFSLAGNTTATCTPSVSGVAAGNTATATIKCTATVGGVNYFDTCDLSYTNTTAGGVTYTPAGGSYNATDNGAGGTGATYTISASASVVWTWSTTSSAGLSSTVASGGSATSITFTLNQGLNDRESVITLTSGGNTWTLDLFASGSNSSTVTL